MLHGVLEFYSTNMAITCIVIQIITFIKNHVNDSEVYALVTKLLR